MYSILVYYHMPHVSFRKLPKKTEEELIANLRIVFRKIHKEEEMSSLFFSLLSSTEQLMLAKRLAIIVLLREGVAEQKIADALNVTRITVEKMRLFMETKGKGFNIALKKLEEEQRLEDFKKTLLGITDYMLNPISKTRRFLNDAQKI